MSSNENQRPRILLVGPFPPTTGGVTTFMLNLMGSFLREEFEFVSFNTSRPPKKNTIDNWGYAAMFRGGIRRIVAGIAITAFHVFKFPLILLFRRIEIVQIQASDFQAFWEAGLYALVARLLGRAVVIRIGGAFDLFWSASSPLTRRLMKFVLGLPHTVIAQSEMLRDVISRAGRDGPILVLPNWPKAEYIRNPLRASRPRARFLFIAGTDAKRKGVEEVLEAARLLDRQGDSALFHFLGVPDILAGRIAQLSLSNIAAVEGIVSHARVLEVMKASDVFLLPSHGEGFPNSLIEAMACGLPAIVTPVGGVPEIVQGGGARVIPVGNAVALADAISDLAKKETSRLDLGKAAFGNLTARYTAERNLPRLGAVYRSIVELRKSRRAGIPKTARPSASLNKEVVPAVRIIIIGPIAQPGLPAKGGYQSSNLRLQNLLRTITPDVSALPYPETAGSIFSKSIQYAVSFACIVAKLLTKSGKNCAIHFTPLFRQFLVAEVLVALAARAGGYVLTIDIRAGSQAIDYAKAGPLYRWFFRGLISLASTVTFEGEAYRAFLQGVLPGRDATVLPNYVTEATLRRKHAAARSYGPNLIYVGAICEAKGITAALRVLGALQTRLPRTTMTLVGATATGYRDQLRAAKLDSLPVWAGTATPQDVEAHLDNSHFFIFLTHWFGEGQSNALTEAMARGCVPIVTDHGFNAATVGVQELTVTDRDNSEAIASRIADIWLSGDWLTLSDQMVSRVANNFTDRQVLAVLRKLYSKSLVAQETQEVGLIAAACVPGEDGVV